MKCIKPQFPFLKLFSLLGALLIFIAGISAQTQDPDVVRQAELKRAQERTKQIKKQQPTKPDVRLGSTKTKPEFKVPLDEKPCFPISRFELVGNKAGRFQFALGRALRKSKIAKRAAEKAKASGPKAGVNSRRRRPPCLGAKGINGLIALTQNALIERGYVTTRVVARPQNLKRGVLTLTVVPGRVGNINQTSKNREALFKPNSFFALPFYKGEVLNLRDLEQGLENLRRVPTIDAKINIVPGKSPNESDLLIAWERKKKIPIRVNFSLDNAGSRATGKYQGNITLSIDNPFSANDIFYISYGQDLFGYDTVRDRDSEGNETGKSRGGARNWSAFYSIPFGKWELSLDASSYRYRQAIAGANDTIVYSGKTNAQNITLSRMVYRDRTRKIKGYVKGWTRWSNNFIDDSEVEVQRRRTAGYELGVSYKQYLGRSELNFGIAYRRGTGANGSLRAPEELFGEGTSRMKIFTGDFSFGMPFRFQERRWAFSSVFHGQLNKTPLIAQDKLSIGGRSTVRGFDGEFRLNADRGFFVRNELVTPVFKKHQVYYAVDAGHLTGPSTRFLIGKTLVGTALGMRGRLSLFKNFYYDAFVGLPVYKPRRFRTDDVTVGFSLNYSF